MNLQLSRHARRRMRERNVTEEKIKEVIYYGVRRAQGTTKEGHSIYKSYNDEVVVVYAVRPTEFFIITVIRI